MYYVSYAFCFVYVCVQVLFKLVLRTFDATMNDSYGSLLHSTRTSYRPPTVVQAVSLRLLTIPTSRYICRCIGRHTIGLPRRDVRCQPEQKCNNASMCPPLAAAAAATRRLATTPSCEENNTATRPGVHSVTLDQALPPILAV